MLDELPESLNRRQQVNEAGSLVARYLYSGGNPQRLLAVVSKLLLPKDRSFHVIQEIEAAFGQYSLLGNTEEGIHVLVAAARYLAAHSPTTRSQGKPKNLRYSANFRGPRWHSQTYQTAERLHRGDRLFEES